MGTMIGGDCPEPKKKLDLGDYFVAAFFMFAAFICSRFIWTLAWGKDVSNLSYQINMMCIGGIIIWLAFIIVGWVKYSQGKVRYLWVLIAATVLTGVDIVVFVEGYMIISLAFAMFIFLLIALFDFIYKREWWA